MKSNSFVVIWQGICLLVILGGSLLTYLYLGNNEMFRNGFVTGFILNIGVVGSVLFIRRENNDDDV